MVFCAFSNFIFKLKKNKSPSTASGRHNDFEEKNEDDICHVIFSVALCDSSPCCQIVPHAVLIHLIFYLERKICMKRRQNTRQLAAETGALVCRVTGAGGKTLRAPLILDSESLKRQRKEDEVDDSLPLRI